MVARRATFTLFSEVKEPPVLRGRKMEVVLHDPVSVGGAGRAWNGIASAEGGDSKRRGETQHWRRHRSAGAGVSGQGQRIDPIPPRGRKRGGC